MVRSSLKERKIFFRFNIDQGKNWGFGHFNRSLSIAKFFLKKKNLKFF